jgi:hypothetical protein
MGTLQKHRRKVLPDDHSWPSSPAGPPTQPHGPTSAWAPKMSNI